MQQTLSDWLSDIGNGEVLIVLPGGIKQKHPSLATMKFISFLKNRDILFSVFVGNMEPKIKYSHVFLSTLFTYDSKKYSDCLSYYQKRCPDAKFMVGGIFASLMPEYFEKNHGISPFVGLCPELDAEYPDLTCLDFYGIKTDRVIVHASRGCPNSCGYCCVPKIEGPYRSFPSILETLKDAKSQKDLKGVLLFDNNFTVHPQFLEIVDELRRSELPVDFSQGLDCVPMTEEKMRALSTLRFDSQSNLGTNYIRFAFDKWGQKDGLERTLTWCRDFKIKASYFAYFLYNFKDSPSEFYEKIRCVNDVVKKVGRTVFLFPQEYAPLDSLVRHNYVSEHWTKEQLTGLRKLYTHICGFVPVTVSENIFNWIGKDEKEFLQLLDKYGHGVKVEKLHK